MAKNEYKEQLESPEWQKKRLFIMERDNFTCQRCNSQTKPLVVHHIMYLPYRKPWEYDGEYLITLCKDCHAYEHATQPTHIKELIKRMKLSGFMSDDFRNLTEQYDKVRLLKLKDITE
jgi:5-methylcytosine-specific restriction endonuclease McrA